MELLPFRHEYKHEILKGCVEKIQKLKLAHYDTVGPEALAKRFEVLYHLLYECIKDKQVKNIINYAEKIAQERFEDGYDLMEVQTAFNTIEELVWQKIIEHIPAPNLGEALGIVSTIPGNGKDKLASSYVSLASKRNIASIDMHRLFDGTV